MKEKIFAKIKASLGKTDFSERTLMKKAELLAKKVKTDEDLTDELIDDVVEELKEMQGQFNHDVAEAIKNQKKPEEEKAPKEEKPEKKKPETEPNSEVAKLLERLDSLETRLSEKDTESKNKAFKEKVLEGLKKGGADNEVLLKAALYDVAVDYKKSLEDNVTLIRKSYDDAASKTTVEEPFFGGGGGGETVSDAEREAARLARKEKILKSRRV